MQGRVPRLAGLALTAGVLIACGLVLVIALPPGEAVPRALFVLPGLVALVAGAAVLRHADTDERRTMQVVVGMALLAQGAAILVEAMFGPASSPLLALSSASVLYALGRVGTAAALLLDPALDRSRRSLSRLGADAALVAVAVVTAGWAWYGSGWAVSDEGAGRPSALLVRLGIGAAALALGVGVTAAAAPREPTRARHRMVLGIALLLALVVDFGAGISIAHPELGWSRFALALTLAHPVLFVAVVVPAEDAPGAGTSRHRGQAWPVWIAGSALSLVVVVWTGVLATRGELRGTLAWLLLGNLLVGAIGYALHRRAEARLLAGLSAEARDGQVALRGQASRFEAMIRHASDYVALVGHRGELRYQSSSVERILGHTPRVPGFAHLVHPEDRQELHRVLTDARNFAPDPARGELRAIHADGTYRVLDVLATDLTSDPDVEGVVLNARDVSDRQDLEQRLKWRATHDTLTQLANRDLLVARVRRAVQAPGRTRACVLFVDLDGFKTVNDTLGHSAGDDLLRLVAERLRAATRGADLVARLGGDEFAVLLTDVDAREARQVAARVVEALREPVELGEHEVLVHGSVGLALAEDGLGVDDLLVQADLAMYDAKGSGGNRISTFDPAMNANVAERLDLTSRLRDAIADGAIRVQYQPVVDTQTGQVHSAEALARWEDPAFGVVSPGRFVPLAEETGLVGRLGRLVLDDAIQTLAAWHRRQPDAAGSVAVNVSARELSEPSFSAWISAALQSHGVEPHLLTLEITERLLVDGEGPVLDNLNALRRVGVRVAVDDFGTGYSSLSMLDKLPADVLKIDRAFVTALRPDNVEASLAAVIQRLATTLHLETVAEGVETDDQVEALRRIGCTYIQGYRFHSPGSLDDLVRATSGDGSGDASAPPATGTGA